MKKLLLSAAFLPGLVSSQVFTRDAGSKEFRSLMEKGITFTGSGPMGNGEVDNMVIAAFLANWKASDFQIYEKGVTKLENDNIVVFRTIGAPKLIWQLHDSSSRFRMIGTFNLDGFTQSSGDDVITEFADLGVKAMNELVMITQADNITNSNFGLYKAVARKILPKAAVLKTKTLLIIDKTAKSIDPEGLAKTGIRHKVLSFDEFLEMGKSDRDKHCLLYLSLPGDPQIAIFDLETSELVYTHYYDRKNRFGEKEFEDIAELLKQ